MGTRWRYAPCNIQPLPLNLKLRLPYVIEVRSIEALLNNLNFTSA